MCSFLCFLFFFFVFYFYLLGGIANTSLQCICYSTNKNSTITNLSLRSHHLRKDGWLAGQFQPLEGRRCKTERQQYHTRYLTMSSYREETNKLCQLLLAVSIVTSCSNTCNVKLCLKNTLNCDISERQRKCSL